ncbi:MAG TPA: hypothetical protein PK743_13145 [Luteimonas sp.]|nr:hypothetical protein [Luteimonas sp.]HRO27319.1 hypothetical protein [Luteimonas sp.]HRP73564.1 hypothetical protein [Luteimonas sp.]
MGAGPDRDATSSASPSRRRWRLVLPALLAAILLAACAAPAPSLRNAAGDTALPRDIARALQTDERVLDCATGTADGRSLFQDDWVRVRRIDLDGDGDQDWLLEGRAPCLHADGLSDWWIYAEGEGHRRLIGTQRSARAVEVLETRSHGFSDLRMVTPDGATTVRYTDGGYRMPTE